jgi:uncharacterized repeat protein (TIGR01451 family)
MTARSWIRRVFSPTPRTSRKAPARVRPGVERLEDRLAPANFTVNTLADDGSAGSLRMLMFQAGSLFGQASTITIPSSLFAGNIVLSPADTIRLTGTQLPTITGQLTITGAIPTNFSNDTLFTVSGEGNSRVFQVGPGGNLTLNNLIIENGTVTDNGGGILNQGSLTLENVTISGNTAANGGGIDSTGPALTIDHSIIAGNTASMLQAPQAYSTLGGGGVFTSKPTATFTHDKIINNTVTGNDQSGKAEGGGIDISSGNVSISFTTIDGNAVQAGAGGPGAVGTSYDTSHRPFKVLQNGNGMDGGMGNTGGVGGPAQGGGIAVDGGSLSIANSTLSHNTTLGGLGGTGGAGGTGQGGTDGNYASLSVPAMAGFVGGIGGQGGPGGMGGPAQGGGLFVGNAVTNLTTTDSTVADNQATGGQGGQSGVGGNGGDGGNGGAGDGQNGAFGAGGVGGKGGQGGTTGAPGTADGAGVYFGPSSNTRQIASSTIAFNNVSRGADAQPVTIPVIGGYITLPASPGGKGGLGGYPGQPATQVAASSGANGPNGVLGTPQAVYGGGLCEDDSISGVGFFRLDLFNSIVAANTANTSSASDIAGTLAGNFYVANLIGPGDAGGLVNGQQENQVGVSAPGLLPLGNYGGETQTVALANNSPAIDAGDNVVTTVTTDQRGVSRISNGKVDIGAFELQKLFVVTTLQDRDDGSTDPGLTSSVSLRDVITLAKASSTPQTIRFAPGLTGTITLTLGELQIANNMTIDGPGANLVSISGNNANRVFEIDSGSVAISGLSIINGYATNGGGILNSGSLTLDSVVISNNNGTGNGGGIWNSGSLTLDSVVISNNTANTDGGGAYTTGGTFTVTDSTISNNNALNRNGGGICNETAPINVVNSTIAGNIARQAGGGIYTDGITLLGGSVPFATDDLTSVTIAANTANDGNGVSLWSATRLNLTNSIIGDGLQDHILYGRGQSGFACYGGNLIAGSNIAGVISADPKLGPLQNNGGPIPTMALLPGSPAVDAGVNSLAVDGSGSPLTTDQNGRPRISGANVDLGAYEVQPASLSLTPAIGTQGVPYSSQTVTATQPGNQASWGTLTFAVTGGTPPTGLSLSPGGVLSGTPTAPGTFNFTITASDLAGFGSQQYSVTINPTPPISLSPTLPNGTDGTPYSQAIMATQAGYQTSWGPINFAVTAGTLPTGLNLTTAGVLSGTPTAPGTFNFTVAASDLSGFGAGSQQVTVTVNPPPAPVVDTPADNFDYDYSAGHLSLREALYIAQLPGVSAPVTFAPGLHGKIMLAGGQLAVTSGVTIQGPGANVLAIDAGGQSSVFAIAGADPAHPSTTNISGLTITNAGNGAGISNTNDMLSLSGVVVTGNSADGIDNDQAVLSVMNSTISSNLGNGILDAGGTVNLADSTVANNDNTGGYGGGISVVNAGASGATVTAVNTTIAGNTAHLGGGIYSSDSVFGLVNAVPLHVNLTNVTVAGNSATYGAGIYNSLASTLTIDNTILGANTGAPDLTNDETYRTAVPGGAAITVARGGNLVESVQTVINGGSRPVGSEFDASPPVISADPMLGPLQNNSGPTSTMALLPGSPAIDKGDSTIAGLPGTDQRGYARIVGNAVDIGAYEYGATPATTDLSISGKFSPTVLPGGSIVYSLTVTNDTPFAESNVTLTDNLPAGTTFEWASSAWNYSAPAVGKGGTVTAWTNSMPAYSAAGLILIAKVDSNFVPASASLTDTATVGPITGDSNSSNNSITLNTGLVYGVAAVQVNDGSAQRSEVRSISVTFSGPVTFAGGNAAAAFQLLHEQTGNNVALSATTSTDSLGRTVVTLGFSGGETDPVSGLNGGIASLADGRYQLTVLAANVIGPYGIPLAGNGTDAGSNYVSPADTYQGNGLHLYRLFGDVNGDGVDDATDVGLLKSTFNRNNTDPLYLWYLDADNSGSVDASDIGQFKSRFNVNVFG